jgi:hypothetical protein
MIYCDFLRAFIGHLRGIMARLINNLFDKDII